MAQTAQGLTPEQWQRGRTGDDGQYGAGDASAGDASAGDASAGDASAGDASAGDASLSAASSRRKAALIAVAVVAVLIASGTAAFALAAGNRNSGDDLGLRHRPVALKPPECSRAAAAGPRLRAFPAVRVRGRTGKPFGVAVSSDGKAVFVVTDAAVQVYKAAGKALTYSGRSYPVGSSSRKATTATLTRDGRYLLVASDTGIKVLDAIAAENGGPNALLGTLTVPGLAKYSRAIGVAVTPDDKFAFVSLQFRDQVGVFNLGKAISHRFAAGRGYYVGSLDVGAQPVGLAMSYDGSTLYATAFRGNSAVPGILSVVDVVRATSKGQLANAVISKVTTGCYPARIVVTRDDKKVWVTARESDYLLGYSAWALRHRPERALIAKVHVGQQPIGIAIVGGGRQIVVSDSDSTTSLRRPGSLAVVDAGAALSHKQALLGYIPAGRTPHEMAASPDGRVLYVTDYDGSELQIINLRDLP